jgi:hypothetical protein
LKQKKYPENEMTELENYNFETKWFFESNAAANKYKPSKL